MKDTNFSGDPPLTSSPPNLLTSSPLTLLTTSDLDLLHEYLSGLSEATKRRFGPHPFDMESLIKLYSQPELYAGYLAHAPDTGKIIAYSILKRGILEHDRPRLESYGLKPDPVTDATYAPSVADEWQGKGLGTQLFHFMISRIPPSRIILWGGVQCSNEHAVNYYLKLGFSILGSFEYYGWNYDMIREI